MKKGILIYAIVWAVLLAWFWLFPDIEGIGFSLTTFYLALPIASFVSAFLIGREKGLTVVSWLMILFFCFMYSLMEYFTFSLANTISTGNIHFLSFDLVYLPLICSALGLIAGHIIRGIKERGNDR